MEMNKLLSLAFVFLIQFSIAQKSNYWIALKDKNTSTYSLKHPENFLSAKALQRRERQHIALTSSDLPVSPAYIAKIKSTGVHVLACSRWFNTICITTDDEKKIAQITSLPFVKEIKKVNINGLKKSSKF